MKTLWRILGYSKRYPWRALTALVLAILGTLLVLVLPTMTKRFIDVVIEEERWGLIWSTAGIAIAAIAVRQLLLMFQAYLNTAFGQLIVHDLRRGLYQKIQRLPMRWFDKQPTGDIMTRVGSDVPAMERVIVEGIDRGLSGLLQLVIVLGYMFYLHVGMTLTTLAPMPFVALATWLYSRKNEARYQEAKEASSELNSLLHDNIAGIRQIKAYTVEPEELERFEKSSGKVHKTQMVVAKANAMTWPAVSLVAESGIVMMMAAASFWVLKGELSIGDIGAFLFAWGYLYDPISRINPLTQMFVNGVVAGKRVFTILDMEDEKNLVEGDRPEHLRGDVVFEDVSFSYEEDVPVVKHVSLEAKSGQTVALVGPTGAGKSTLLNLLTRFYECGEGRIKIDGRDSKELSKEWLRDHIGYVTQESFLFNASIRENLRLAKRNASEEELWAALRAANAEDFVKELPDGIDTISGERGTRLSGGERQRISIARALLKNPPILLLDEATSAVDNETERLIQGALANLRANRTSFVIAHRLTTVREADLICVLQEGEIVERGGHEALLEADGLYAKLCAAGFEEASS